MQQYRTPAPGRTPRAEPNIVNRDDYKMHILKRSWGKDEHEILIERWIPESGWSRTQILCDDLELAKIRLVLGC